MRRIIVNEPLEARTRVASGHVSTYLLTWTCALKAFIDVCREQERYVKTLIPTENSTANLQHKNAIDYTTIADRLRMVSWSNNSTLTGLVKPVKPKQETHIYMLQKSNRICLHNTAAPDFSKRRKVCIPKKKFLYIMRLIKVFFQS